MTTAYPGGIDSFTDPTSSNSLSDPPVKHSAQHANLNDAMAAVQAELGTNPSGTFPTVAAAISPAGINSTTDKRGSISASAYIQVGATDMTSYLQQMLTVTSTSQQVATIPPGVYPCHDLVLGNFQTLEGMGGGTSRYQGTNNQRGAVVLQRLNNATTDPIVTLAGAGATLRNITIDGGRGSVGATTVAQPAIIAQGFESVMQNVRVIDAVGTGIDVQKSDNNKWRDIHVDICGAVNNAAMIIRSLNNGDGSMLGGAYATNNFTVFGLTIEQPQWVGLDVAYGTGADAYAEYVRLYDLHMEHDPNVAPTFNAIRWGNVLEGLIVGGMCNWGPTDFLLQNQQNFAAASWVTQAAQIGMLNIVGYQFQGGVYSSTGTNFYPSENVRATAGTGLFFSGCTFNRINGNPVLVDSTYSGAVYTDENSRLMSTTSGTRLITDSRTVHSNAAWKRGEGSAALSVPVGGYSWPENHVTPTTSAAPASGVVQASPIKLRTQVTCDAIAFEVTTAAVGGDASLMVGIYPDNMDGSGPDLTSLIASATVAALTATGVQTATFSAAQTLPAGRYWLAYRYGYNTAPTTAPQFRAIGSATALPAGGWNSGYAYQCVAAGGKSTLPTGGTLGVDTNMHILLGLHRSA